MMQITYKNLVSKNLVFILLLLSATLVDAADLGRLFTQPNLRQELDYLRKIKKINPNPQPVEEVAPVAILMPEPQDLPEQINMNGYVKRSDGKQSTVWINDKMMTENSRNQEIAVGRVPSKGNKVAVQVRANGKVVGLKAGQVYLPEANQIIEKRATAPEINGETTSGKIGDEAFAQ